MDILITFTYGEEELAELPLASLAQFVLKSEGKPANTEVSISFVDNATIAELNERFRGILAPCTGREGMAGLQGRGGCGKLPLV